MRFILNKFLIMAIMPIIPNPIVAAEVIFEERKKLPLDCYVKYNKNVDIVKHLPRCLAIADFGAGRSLKSQEQVYTSIKLKCTQKYKDRVSPILCYVARINYENEYNKLKAKSRN